MKNVVVGIPAFNEEDNIIPLLKRFAPLSQTLSQKNYKLQVLVVDDGSRDQTGQRVEDFASRSPGFDIAIVKHPENRGLAAAVETIFAKAHEHPALYALGLLDGDDSHDPSTFLDLLERV